MSLLFMPSTMGIHTLPCTISMGSIMMLAPSDILFHERDASPSRPFDSCSIRKISLPMNLFLTNRGLARPMPGLKLRSVMGMEFSRMFQNTFCV